MDGEAEIEPGIMRVETQPSLQVLVPGKRQVPTFGSGYL